MSIAEILAVQFSPPRGYGPTFTFELLPQASDFRFFAKTSLGSMTGWSGRISRAIPSPACQPFEPKLGTLRHPGALLWGAFAFGVLPRTQTGAPMCFFRILGSGTSASCQHSFVPPFGLDSPPVAAALCCSPRHSTAWGPKPPSLRDQRLRPAFVASHLIPAVSVVHGLTSGSPVATQGQYI